MHGSNQTHVVRIENDAKHAWYIEKGTRPHIIRARFKKALRFIGRDGSPVFRKWVMHPGTKAYRFFSIARDHGFVLAGNMLAARMTAIAAKF